MYAIPKADALYDIGPKAGEPRRPLNSDERRDMVDRHEQFVEEMTKATVAGLTGETAWGDPIDRDRPREFPIMGIRKDSSRAARTAEVWSDVEMAKGVSNSPYQGAKAELLSKEWTLHSEGRCLAIGR